MAIPVLALSWEHQLLRFREEIGRLKEDLKTPPNVCPALDDNYRLATQIDLAVNRFLRLAEQIRE